ncbi:hypothetical protein MJO28_010529 [Puccinia striiformis f. sp. tritici]|uniref:RGS domain-containing protein n=3 Tax=Puccinia striiformis TaxID=27350 RepID=A0A0L0V3U1_9BASI|nr:hypothetical protein Pst134EA_019334 [Puccinia striiformis f. sp. tritici]KNE93649.1 hypothetical protein PSTG_12935 [Puccinia striiformis f. sp. tritici PST-78]POW16446.1 hypothetical protein PSTT_01272 [Puccinia striiformis]KAH9449409.1 hypothetical protein Pst134EB_020232 [Puccinia striiformis f. sp. tritici]KAH9459181.1 hypothetical protein Pst134EA_019334 [Puccinia striiformis f. sp. tritici]KAI7944834.1 hypothetical protein MJO28_010529 [Puccinia striiformis f. sp. tritici]
MAEGNQAEPNRPSSLKQERPMNSKPTPPSSPPILTSHNSHTKNHNIDITQQHHHPPQQQQEQQQKNASLHPSMARNRLPTLQEVLARQTRPPVDLYCFYLYLQRERAEDSLDFWLDAQQHENLCRAYFKDLRRNTVHLRDEWPDYYQRACTRGSVYNPLNGISRQSRLMDENMNPIQKPHPPQSINSSRISQQGMPSPIAPHVSPALRALFPHDKVPSHDEDPLARPTRQGSTRARTPIQPVIPRSSAITRTDLIASAERIYYRYLLSGAEKEIYLPSALRIHNFPINSASLPHAGSPDYEDEANFLAMIPDMFVSQKEYIYRSMERDTFPRFLRSKAFGNLTPLSSIIRLSVGLFAIWIGLSVGLSLIFLDIHPRVHRLWSMIPLSIGAIGIIGHFYELDPILILFNRSETTFFRTLSVKEKYVQKILRGRALWVILLSTIIVACLTCILVFVPGHRL